MSNPNFTEIQKQVIKEIQEKAHKHGFHIPLDIVTIKI